MEVIRTPKGETVLDMGQNMTGWMEYSVKAPAGTKIRLQHGEILQDGNFYVENLRTAKQEFIYTCHEGFNQARSHFTFYGFRYVLVDCLLYTSIILLGAPFMASSLTLNNQLRFQGSAMFAMVGITAGGILNIILDPE